VERIAAAGIARVVASVEDPNPSVRGAGFHYLRERGIEVEVGVGREAALRLNAPFFTAVREQRPFVIAKIALSQDGRVAAQAGARTQLTSGPANRRVHLLRAEVDAIGVGVDTVLSDNPRLTVRGVFRQRPLTRVVFDRRLRTPPSARLFSTLDAGPVILLTADTIDGETSARAAALERAGAIVEKVPGGELRDMVARLLTYDVQSLLLEGGPRLHRAAWRAGIVDRVMAFFCPVTFGNPGVPWLTRDELSLAALHDLHMEPLGPDVLVDGYVHRPH
jgi:diaminohydroxyphosphoribosylaminopyrimidine deaminase/5-amino-6-(5-phosphoribosylamino)uracil reductase